MAYPNSTAQILRGDVSRTISESTLFIGTIVSLDDALRFATIIVGDTTLTNVILLDDINATDIESGTRALVARLRGGQNVVLGPLSPQTGVDKRVTKFAGGVKLGIRSDTLPTLATYEDDFTNILSTYHEEYAYYDTYGNITSYGDTYTYEYGQIVHTYAEDHYSGEIRRWSNNLYGWGGPHKTIQTFIDDSQDLPAEWYQLDDSRFIQGVAVSDDAPTEGELLVYDESYDMYIPGTDPTWGYIGRYGFIDLAETTISFVAGTYTFTLGSVGTTWRYMRDGIVYTITGDKTVVLSGSPPSTDTYYIYINDGIGTLTASTSPWTLTADKVPVAMIIWDDTLTPKYHLAEERHQCLIDRKDHAYHHLTQGTQLLSGGVLADYVVPGASPSSDDDNTFSITEAVIADEDLFQTLAALADPSGSVDAYTIFNQNGVGTWEWADSEVPLAYTPAGYIQYENSGTMTEGANAKYYNYYLMFTNFDGDSRFVLVPGRSEFSSADNAYLETLEGFSWTNFPIAELVAAYQLTFVTNSSYTTKGKCKLTREPVAITTSLISIVAPDPSYHQPVTIEGSSSDVLEVDGNQVITFVDGGVNLDLELMKMSFQSISWSQFAIFDPFYDESMRASPDPSTFDALVENGRINNGEDITADREFGFVTQTYTDITVVTTGTSDAVASGYLEDTDGAWFDDQYIGFTLIDSALSEFTITDCTETPRRLVIVGTPAAGAYSVRSDQPAYTVGFCSFTDSTNGGYGYVKLEISFDNGANYQTILDTENTINNLEGALVIDDTGDDYIGRLTLKNDGSGNGSIVRRFLVCTDPSMW